ncbi:MAG: NADH-quinone oxidoreductase subunit NuoG [Anaerolineae bacterium]|nr:NADH-quinone oxidoreductase subunit NuoG [Anaerolineae bacterium]
MSEKTFVRLTIDDQEISVPAGSTVYEAATAAGIHIPTFCHHEKLVPVGACRQCLVEIEGMVNLQTSCTTPVREGMIVRAWTSPKAVEARRAQIEFLLTNHPLDCPVCDKGGECPLQDQALADGPGRSRYIEEKRHKLKRYPLSDLIVLDQERCVLCWRCIRFLDEWADDHELDLFGRGATTRLETFDSRSMRSKWQGNTIDLCPVGALTSRVFRFEARPWELTYGPSVCPLCSVGCNLTLHVKNNTLRRLTPRENMQVNDAWLCDVGRFGHAFVDHPDRLMTPLVRRGEQLEPATWAEALALIGERLRAVVNTSGAEAVAGISSTHATNEANYLFQRLMRSLIGTNNIDHLDRAPLGSEPLASLPALEQADVVLLLGFDPSTEAPLVELWLKKAVLRHQARVIVANPWLVEMGRYEGPWLGYRPGSGVTMLNGLAHAVLEAGGKGTGSRGFHVDEVRNALKGYHPAQVARLAGTSAQALAEAGKLLATARRPVILYGPQWLLQNRNRHQAREASTEGGLPALDAIANLSLLLAGAQVAFVPPDANTLGALDMGAVPRLLPGRQAMSSRDVRSRLASFWGSRLSPVSGLDLDMMFNAAGEGRLGAMWILGADPARNYPGAVQALAQIPFLIVQELFLTQTAAMADVVLPGASFAETDGTLTNMTGRVQKIEAHRLPPGSALPDWQIVVEVARHLADDKQRRAWDFATAGDVLDEIRRVVPAYQALDEEALEGEGWQPSASESRRRAWSRIEAMPTAAPGDDYPLILVIGHVLFDQGPLLRWSDAIEKSVPEPFVLVHPDDARKAGVVNGQVVRVESPHSVPGAEPIDRVAQVSDGVVPGVVWAPLNLGDELVIALFEKAGALPWVRIAAVDPVPAPGAGHPASGQQS